MTGHRNGPGQWGGPAGRGNGRPCLSGPFHDCPVDTGNGVIPGVAATQSRREAGLGSGRAMTDRARDPVGVKPERPIAGTGCGTAEVQAVPRRGPRDRRASVIERPRPRVKRPHHPPPDPASFSTDQA